MSSSIPDAGPGIELAVADPVALWGLACVSVAAIGTGRSEGPSSRAR